MTISTFDLAIRNMFSVHELGGIPGAEDFTFIMALEAFPLRDMTIPLNHIDVTSLTGHPPFNVPPVIEVPTLDLDISFRFDVARSAPSYSTRDAFVLSSKACPVEMADKTVSLVNR
jgi:hypothetical protein